MREVPFGEGHRSSKKSLYKIADPFLNFYFRFVVPNRSFIEIEQSSTVLELFSARFPRYVSGIWEEICRQAVPALTIGGIKFRPAGRWWGSPEKGGALELDVVAESLDGRHLLVDECKWTDKEINPDQLKGELFKKAAYLPFSKGKTIVPVVFIKQGGRMMFSYVFGPKEILDALRS